MKKEHVRENINHFNPGDFRGLGYFNDQPNRLQLVL